MDGQIIQISLSDAGKLKDDMNILTSEMTKYDFNKNRNYTSNSKLNEIPNDMGFNQKREGIYQKIIQNDQNDYQDFLEKLNLKSNEDLLKVNFENESVIITASKYEINNIQENVGNVKYEFGKLYDDYFVSALIVSKVVNINCIYYNVIDSKSTTQIGNSISTTTSGIIKNITENKIEVGLSDSVSTYMASINDNVNIINYESNAKMNLSELKVGDSIYLEGKSIGDYNNLKGINASKIEICSKERIKKEIGKFLMNTYRIDGMSIEYLSADNLGKGYIIVACSFDKFIYPLKLNVNNRTETFLGMSYHLKSNYGYVLHEICDITLDTKITDVDNINGLVKSIEYIAD